MKTKDLHFINPRNLQLFENHGIDVIYPKKPCPKGLQALSEIIIQNDDESMGWPCMNDPWEWHKKDSKIDGTCRSGMYLYTSGHTFLTKRFAADSARLLSALYILSIPGHSNKKYQ